ncbi:MAG: hypothetical protein JNL40_00210 [Cyclobacteriaceae bacterium]|nr:hypothetical protein [Cyclobacteriaceae bacterium]
MMRFRTPALLLFVILLVQPVFAQNKKEFAKAMRQLRAFASSDSVGIQGAVDKWWNERKRNYQVPLTSQDSAVFLYRGKATSVSWAGDFNGWGSKPFNNKGVRVRNTDIWILPCLFPSAARLDYKIILNGKDWILDPDNPNQQYSGVGGGSPNSELHMPAWRIDPALRVRKNVTSGTLTESRINSKILGYEVSYKTYQPAASSPGTVLPVLYVTDGSEYLDPRLGNMTRVLDNLLADKRIVALRVVFVDARDPSNLSVNRRMEEMSLNEKYLAFFSDELIPAVEGTSASSLSGSRGILGTSLGGLTSAYFGFQRPDLFNRIGIQSPAFWYKPQIFTMAEQVSNKSLEISMTAGTVYDTSTEAAKMKSLVDKQGIRCTYLETPEGHSWGNWKNLLDDILIGLYGAR